MEFVKRKKNEFYIPIMLVIYVHIAGTHYYDYYMSGMNRKQKSDYIY
jgi:hypothetical protein